MILDIRRQGPSGLLQPRHWRHIGTGRLELIDNNVNAINVDSLIMKYEWCHATVTNYILYIMKTTATVSNHNNNSFLDIQQGVLKKIIIVAWTHTIAKWNREAQKRNYDVRNVLHGKV